MRQLKITKQITQRNEESINRYFQEINKFPMISAEEEVDLTRRIKKGDSQALEELVVANLRFVISVAKQYQGQGLSFPDLINEGNVGLVKAASKFDETRGFKFISYAVWWIRQSITQAISEQTRIVRLPLNKIASITKVNKAVSILEQEYEREPSENEIAEYLEVEENEVAVTNEIKMKQVSFDKPLEISDSGDLNLYDKVHINNIPQPDDNIMKESLAIDISRALRKLTTREAEIIRLSFGLENSPSYTLHDIAIKFDMSSERIRQIRSRGLLKLKGIFKGKMYAIELS